MPIRLESPAVKRRIIVAIAFLLLAVHSFAQSATGPETLLRALYASHQPWANKDVLNDGHMSDFFDARLVRLIDADRNCKAPDWGVGNLDFDPILSAQDYGDNGIAGLQIKHLGAEKYEVSFLLFPGVSKERTRLTYSLAKTSRGWRITDIQYENTTLLKVLAPPCK